MGSPNMWQKRVLVPLWAIHIICLLGPIAGTLTFVISQPTYLQRTSWFWRIDNIFFFVCLVLEFIEIKAFKRRKLQPSFYLGSQTSKSLFFTWHLYRRVVWWSTYPPKSVWNSLTEIASTCTFYVGLAYALSVFARQRRLRRSFLAAQSNEELSYNDDAEDRFAAFMPPVRINSSSRIESQTPILIRMIQWTNLDPIWPNKLRSPLQASFKKVFFVLRYVINFGPIVFLLPFFSRLPGEPQNPRLVMDTASLEDWDYVKPTLARSNAYTDNVHASGESSNARRPGDEEHAADVFSLRTVDQEPRTSRTVRNMPRSPRQISPPRSLGPRYLCFLTDTRTEATGSFYVVRRVDKSQTATDSDYVFISYTRRQFYTQNTFRPNIPPTTLAGLKAAAERDKATLVGYAITAAKEAGVPAFWADFECVRPEDDGDEEADMEDVYRICDIVRAAHSMSIVIGPPLDDHNEHVANDPSNKAEWVLDWGKRMWTVPEALLCSSEHRITLYATASVEPEKIAKRNLAGRVWDDADTIRQLIDHYEGNLHLTQLELISVALECLQRRQTEIRNSGDVAYVLMGLLRLRPKVDKADSDFQAFAKLSFANDSDMILERIMCLRSPDAESPWHDMRDLWNAKLWHIDPLYQIADIGTKNTVIIGSASGTSIDWESLKLVDFTGTGTRQRYCWHYIRSSSILVLAYCAAILIFQFLYWPALENLASGGSRRDLESSKILALKLLGSALALFVVIAIPVPAWLSQHFRGDLDATQARMFGIKGRPNLGEVETSIFGSDCRRLRWNSDSFVDQEDAKRPEFTIIDTLSCTATLFRAKKAPTIAFIGAREGGMLRMILCSYDTAAGAFVKETIVRMESAVLQRMPRLDRFRFAVAPAPMREDLLPRRSMESDLMELPDIPEFLSIDRP